MSYETWLQLTSGQGPAECAWAVSEVLKLLQKEAEAQAIGFTVLEITPGPQPGTADSVLLALASGQPLDAFIDSWQGTIQWVGRSPYRPDHKRKNWFVAVEAITPPVDQQFDPRDVHWETMRASGPGGQHVNRTESAVRVTHKPTGLQASASEERSQHRNRSLALARLAAKLAEANRQQWSAAEQQRWKTHQALQRGNPTRVLR